MSILCSMGLQNLEVLGSELAELCFRLYLEHFIELSVSAFLYLVDPISPVLKEYFVDMWYRTLDFFFIASANSEPPVLFFSS